MDFLNKAYSQANDLFKSMTPGARITSGMLLVVIVVSMFYLFFFQINTANEYLFGARQFSQAELDAMQSAFATAGLNEFKLVDKRMQVPRAKMVDYLKALSENNFTPVNLDSAIDEAIKGSNSLIDSRQLQDFKFKHAVQKQLGQALLAFPGIDTATVQYRENKTRGFPPDVERKATVIVGGTGKRPLDQALISAVRTTACGWFGIEPTEVTITDLFGKRAFGGDSATSEFGGAGIAYARTKQYWDEYWKGNIYDCLSIYPGVVVGVNVELDPDLKNESHKITVDPQPTALESDTYRKTSDSKPAVGGRPGAVPNEVPSNEPRAITNVAQQETSLDENREKQVSVAGHEQTIRQKAPLRPNLVTATVSIPKSYLQALWEQQPVDQDDKREKDITQITSEVIKTIEETVVKVLPPGDMGENDYPKVTVSTYDDIPVEPIEPPSFAATSFAWLSANWRTIALLAVGLVSLFVLRGMVRAGAPGPADDVVLPNLAAEIDEVPEEEEDEPVILHRRSPSTGASLRDELTAMVREDPDAAANVLRTWIGDAA